MANERRVRQNNQFGTLGGTGLNAGETSSTINFGTTAPGFATVDSHTFIEITLEPNTPNEEIVYLTAYTAGQTTGTVARGQEGTSAIAHASGVPWQHAPTAAGDFIKTVDTPWGGNLGYDYEFDADYSTSLPSGWSWTNQAGGSAAASYREEYGAGTMVFGGNPGAQLIAITRSLPAGGAWNTVTAKICTGAVPAYGSGASPDQGIVIGDGAGHWYALGVVLANTTTHSLIEFFYWTSTTANQVVGGGTLLNAWPSTLQWYGRITNHSASNWDIEASGDGRSWCALALGVNPQSIGGWAGAATAGFFANPNNMGGARSSVSCEWLRVR